MGARILRTWGYGEMTVHKLAWLGLFFAGEAAAQTCGADAVEIGRTQTASQIVITCKCRDDRWYVRNACVTAEAAAPVAAPEYDAIFQGLMAEALEDMDALQNHALAQRWAADTKTNFLWSTFAAAQSQFERALRYLEIGAPESRDDLILEYRGMLQRKTRIFQIRISAGAHVQEALDLARLQTLDRPTARAILEATMRRNEGRFSDAIWYYQVAERFAQRANASQVDFYEIRSALKWTEGLKSRLESRPLPQLGARVQVARDETAAWRAWELALRLQQIGMREQAVALAREAEAGYRRSKPGVAGYIALQTENIAAGRRIGGNYRVPHANARNVLVLDSFEYGKGDWDKSIQYLRLAAEGDSNPQIREALSFVEGLRAVQIQR